MIRLTVTIWHTDLNEAMVAQLEENVEKHSWTIEQQAKNFTVYSGPAWSIPFTLTQEKTT